MNYNNKWLTQAVSVVLVLLTSSSAPAATPIVPLLISNSVVDVQYKPKPVNTDNKQIQCLAENTYHEARGESTAGQIAVTQVVMNRVKDSRFPKTPCGVIKQKNHGGCQFSWVCSGTSRISDRVSYNKILEIVKNVYSRSIRDNTGGATFFHSVHIRTNWDRMSALRIGAHIFYRN